jgi:16S rRNA C967 or C1407 C5-methylase (RsmB/RsmF family)
MIKTYTSAAICIDPDSLKEWLSKYLRDDLPEKQITIINRPHVHFTAESKFYAEIDIDEKVTKTELLKRVVEEHSRGPYVHFYVDDVVFAACTAGVLKGNFFSVRYEW